MKKKINKSLSKKVLAQSRAIKNNNIKFEKLTPAQKRVMIAQDVLAQMESGFLKPTSDVWVKFKKNLPKDPELELQTVLESQESCNVCGLGGIFVCAVRLSNNLKIGRINENRDYDNRQYANNHDRKNVTMTSIFSYLENYFSKGQLNMIESAFEQGGGFIGSYNSNGAECYFHNVNEKLAEINMETATDDRMCLIMQNIIKNKGEFKVDDKNKPKVTFTVAINLPGFVS